MIALHIPDIKDFMNRLLASDLFDHFLMPEAAVTTFITHTIDGHIHPGFFSPDDPNRELLIQGEAAPFALLRPICYQLMKGKQTPLSFKFLFQLSPKNQERTILQSGTEFHPEDITAMFLNLKYQEKQLICTTGISYRTFTLDKGLEQEWDRLITVFLKNHKIPFEIL